MLLADLGVRPALGAVELDHQRGARSETDLVHAVLVAIERHQSPVADEPQRFDRIEDNRWRQRIKDVRHRARASPRAVG